MRLLQLLFWPLLLQLSTSFFLSDVLSKWRRHYTAVVSFRRPPVSCSMMLDDDRIISGLKTEGKTEVSIEANAEQGRTSSTREISPYYRRDRYDNSTLPIPSPHILSPLLEARWQAKQNKNVDEVRALDKDLRSRHGIYVYDQPPIWTRQTEPPLARWRKLAESRSIRRKEKYGPRGHPFHRVGHCITGNDSFLDCSLTEPVIHDLLAQCIDYETRNETQRERADAIRFELSLHGVRVNMTYLQWTTDPNHVFGETNSDKNRDFHNQSLPMYREQKGLSKLGSSRTGKDTKTRQRIEHLIRRRLEARTTGRLSEEIFIQWELKRCYGVKLDDENQTWFAEERVKKDCSSPEDYQFLRGLSSPQIDISGICFPPLVFYQNTSIYDSPAYAKSALSGDIDVAVAHRVCSLVQERIHKREESKYVEADAIRQELWHAYSVGVNDRLQQYSLGGYFDTAS